MENIEARPSKDGKNVTYRVCLYAMVNGKLIRHTKSFNSKKYGGKKMALEIAKEYRDKMRCEMLVPTRACKLDDLMKLKEETIPHTVATNDLHRLFYQKHIRPITGNIDIRKVTALDIQKTLNKMVATKSQYTIRRLFSVWKQLYKTAIVNDLCTFDMTLKVVVPKSDVIPKPKRAVASLDDLETVAESLYKKMDNKRTAVLIAHALYIMYYTGIRPQEVYALTSADIDPIRRSISVNKAVGSNSTDKDVIVQTKTPQSVRTVYYPPALDPVITDLLNNTGDQLFKTGKEILNGHRVSMYITKHRPAGSNFTQYDLRHQFATDLITTGTDVRTVQELMGHASPSMSIEYARSNDKEKKKAIRNRLKMS